MEPEKNDAPKSVVRSAAARISSRSRWVDSRDTKTIQGKIGAAPSLPGLALELQGRSNRTKQGILAGAKKVG